MLKQIKKTVSAISNLIIHGIRVFARKVAPFSPSLASKIIFRLHFHRKLDLKNPKTFNEKLQWLKINRYDNNKLITKCVDKVLVRDYLKEKNLEYILTPIIKICDSIDDIKIDDISNDCVIKCNHGCAYNIINVDNSVDINYIKNQLKGWLNEKYWLKNVEPQYKNIVPKIIIEKYLGDFLTGYKFFCFNGEPQFLFVSNYNKGHLGDNICYFDTSWNLLPYKFSDRDNNAENFHKPNCFDDMLQITKQLCQDFSFVRVDLFCINDGNQEKVFFSELTFLPTGGLIPLDYKTDLELGKLLKINTLNID